MIKVVNPLFRKAEDSDYAYNCACVCNISADNYDTGAEWTWLPWNTCGCACSGTTANLNANDNAAESQ